MDIMGQTIIEMLEGQRDLFEDCKGGRKVFSELPDKYNRLLGTFEELKQQLGTMNRTKFFELQATEQDSHNENKE